MNLLEIDINSSLLLKDSFFENSNKNINYLVSLALNHDQASDSLALMLNAASLCEKFHSYFHFEGAFIYYSYGQKLKLEHRYQEAITQYKLAIFQSHLCKHAHIALIDCYDKLNLIDEKKEALDYIKSFGVDIASENSLLSRPYLTFLEYIDFATENNQRKKIISQNFTLQNLFSEDAFWFTIEKAKQTNDEDLIKKAINQLKSAHESYHRSAAMIYYNCHYLFKILGEDDMAKNALIKAKNLDASVSKLTVN